MTCGPCPALPEVPHAVRVIEVERCSIPLQMNAGLRAARYDTVLVTHDDCWVRPDWVAAAAHLARELPAALISGQVLPAGDGVLPVPSCRTVTSRVVHQGPSAWGGALSREHGRTRERALAIGGFRDTPTFATAAEDLEFCARWTDGGGRLVVDPTLVVWHADRRDPAELDRTWVTYARSAGAFYGLRLAGGDRRLGRIVAREVLDRLVADVRRRLRREPRYLDEYNGNVLPLLRGVVAGWREQRSSVGRP